MEMEKVVKGLEACSMAGTKDDCIGYGCPYLIYNDEVSDDCQEQMFDDALALLKAQEPVKPIENAGFYYCGACKYAFTSARQKYCSECGRAVKWE